MAPADTADRPGRWRRRAGPIVVAVLAVAAGLLAARAMVRGPVNGNDSVTYLAVAGNIAAGRGITSPFALELTGLSPREAVDRQGAEPLTAWPPLYPLALAAGDPLGLDAEGAAAGLNIAAAAATAALTAALARRRGLSWLGAGLVTAVVVVNPATVLVFATAGSESLFVPLSLGALLALARAATGPDRHPSADRGDHDHDGAGSGVGRGTAAALVAFAGLAGAAALTRYAGLALVLTGAVALARWGPGRHPRTRRSIAAVTTLAAAALPAVALAAARAQPGWRPGPDPARPDASLLGAALTGWLLPERNRLVAVAIVLGAGTIAAGTTVALHRRHGAVPSPPPPAPPPGEPAPGRARRVRRTTAVALVYAAAYAAVIVAGAALVDHAIPLGPRLALPLLPVAAVLAGGWVADALDRVHRPVARAAAAAGAVAAVVAVVALQTAATTQDLATRDAAVSWRDRPTPPSLRAVAGLPADVSVFSNQPSSTYARSGRPTLALPLRRSPATGAPNPRAAADEDELVELLRAGRAVVVIERLAAFFAAAGPPTMVGESELHARVPLEVLAEDDEFVVLRRAPTGPPSDPSR